MGFMRGLAAEVGAHGVTANCVALGTMKTGALAEALDARTPSSSASWPGRTRSRGSARPEDPAAARRAALQRAAGWITGQVYPVDGGYVPDPASAGRAARRRWRAWSRP